MTYTDVNKKPERKNGAASTEVPTPWEAGGTELKKTGMKVSVCEPAKTIQVTRSAPDRLARRYKRTKKLLD